MRNIYKLSLALLVSMGMFFGIQDVRASHAMGGDLTYTCIDTNTYVFTLNFYRDCSGVSAPTTALLNFSSSCGTFTATLNQTPCPPQPPGSILSPCEVSPLCPTFECASCCLGDPPPCPPPPGTGLTCLPGVQQFTFMDTISFPPGCSSNDWTISYQICCRNNQITNLQNPGGASIWIESHLNNATGECNSSPFFSSLPVPYICSGQQYCYNHGAVDPDGDSLFYTIINPLGAGGTPIAYTPGFSNQQPLATTGPFVFDSLTGQMCFTPSGPQVGVITVLVEEYRNGVFMGSTIRDLQFVVINIPGCSNGGLTYSHIQQPTVQNGIYVDSNTVDVCPFDTLSFELMATGDTITMLTNLQFAIPNAVFDTVYMTVDTFIGRVTWIPGIEDTGINNFVVFVNNETCPLASNQAFGHTINVLRSTYAGPDRIYCTGGGPIPITVRGGSMFSWTPTTGIVNATPDSSTIWVAPTADTTMYIVQSDLSGNCKNRDTLLVFNVPDFTISTGVTEDTICAYGSTFIYVEPSPLDKGPFQYSWTPSSNLLTPNDSVSDARPLNTTQYFVEVISDTGCVMRDSITVYIDGIAPQIALSIDNNFICPGDTVNITGDVASLPCGLNPTPATPCPPGSSFGIHNIGTSPTSGANSSPYRGFFEDGRIQMLFRAGELPFGAGTITDVGFDVVTKGSTAPYNNFTIKMGCTQLDQLPASYVNGLQTVMVDPAYNTVVGPNFHGLDNPYDWDGVSNLIVEVCFDNTAWTGDDQVAFTTTTFPNSLLWDVADGQVGCSLGAPAGSADRPNVTFIACEYPTNNLNFQWTPSAGLDCDTCQNPVAVVYEDQTYTLTVDDGNCVSNDFITISIDSSYYISTSNDVTICPGDSTGLSTTIHGQAPPSIGTCGAVGSACQGPIVGGFVGTGTNTTGPTPYDGFWHDNRIQMLYRASELPFGPATITDIGFDVAIKASTAPYSNFTIKMGCTSANDLNAPFVGALQTVFVDPSYNSVVGLNTHALNTSFDYDGISNLIVEVCFDNTAWTDDDLVNATATPFNSVLNDFADNDVGCNLAFPASSTIRPNTFFIACDAPPGTINYQWSPTTNISDPNVENPTVWPTTATTYTVTATFANGCERIDSVRVDIGTFPYTLNAVPSDSICIGDSTQLVFNGGNSYSWNPGGTLSDPAISNPFASPAASTTYHITATDSLGCIVEDSIRVTVRPQLNVNIGNDTIICPSDNVVLDPGSGWTSYQWFPNNEVTPTISVSAPGVYYVVVTDANCSYTSNQVVISNYATPTYNLGNDVSVCLGESHTFTAAPGLTNYLWSPNNEVTQSITTSTAGSYSYSATDTNGCQINSTVVQLITINPPAVNLGPDEDACDGESVTLDAGNFPGATFTWNVPGASGQTATVTSGGQYIVTVDDNGCARNDTINVTFNPSPAIDFGQPTNLTICCGVTTLSPGPADQYNWSDGSTASQLTVTTSGSYVVTATNTFGCTSTDSIHVLINCIEPVINALPSSVVEVEDFTIQLGVQPNDAALQYDWDPITYLNPIDAAIVTLGPVPVEDIGERYYLVTVTDPVTGCFGRDSILINVIPHPVFVVPDAFTPNGDGLNDRFKVLTAGTANVKSCQIFNRWGELLYDNAQVPWDGTFKGEPQPAGTYIYSIVVDVPDEDNAALTTEQVQQGAFSLIR